MTRKFLLEALKCLVCFLNETVEADVEDDEGGQVGKHNLQHN
jgi:hypothetical protein